jgi:hypothetical protein
MADKKKFLKLDDIGIVGRQEKKSATSQKYHSKKTGDIFSKARIASNKKSASLKKIS